MAEPLTHPTIGELVAADGSRFPLPTAVTLVGSGDHCDIRLAGLAELHCVLTYTPAGMVLRSWHPETTHVNGQPTTARLLSSGEVIALNHGDYRFVWHWSELVPLESVPADATIAEHIQARHDQVLSLHADLQVAREELRQAPNRLRHARREATAILQEATDARDRAKRLARRLSKRFRARYLAERESLIAGRGQLGRDQAAVEQSRAELAARERELAKRESRLADAWAQLQAERDAHVVALEVAEPPADAVPLTITTTDRRTDHLRDEAESLERRAAQAAEALDRLEVARARLEESLAPTLPDHAWLNAVPLAADPLELMESLAVQDRKLSLDHADLERVRAELARRAVALHDERMVVAEQLSKVLVVRRDWHRAEQLVFAELEAIAAGFIEREEALDARERRVQRLDAERLGRAQDLWKLRLKLEAWQGNLVTHEAERQAAQTRTALELQSRREHLERWESSLGQLAHDWAAVRRRELARLDAELAEVAQERARQRLTLADLDEARRQSERDLATTAAAALASAEAQARSATGDRRTRLNRHLRVGQRRYERHFARFCRDLDMKRNQLTLDTAAADARLAQLRAERAETLTADARLAEREARDLAERQTIARQLDERQSHLAAELAKSQTAMAELEAVRAEVERLSELLTQTPPAKDAATLKLAA